MCCLLGFSLRAQLLSNAYSFSTGVDSTLWVDIDTIAENLISTGGSRSQLKNIGFTFYYGGAEHTQFSVDRYGTLRLGSSVLSGSYYSRPLGANVSSVQPAIVAMCSNATMDESSYVHSAPVGTPGSRMLVVEWYIKLYGSTGGRMRFQIHLFEGTNDIRIVYGAHEGNTPLSPYQIGFAPQSGDVALINVSDNTLVYGSSLSQTNASGTWPEAGRWYRIDYDNTYCDLFTIPFVEDFNTINNLGCWTMLDFDGYSYTHWDREALSYTDYCMWAWRNDYACNDWMVTPPLQLPADSGGLMLMYDFWASGPDGDCGEMEVRVAPYGTGDVPAVDTNDFGTPLRIDGLRSTDGFESRSIRLGDFAGQKVRIAFVHVRLHSNSNIFVDNVRVMETTTPRVRVEAPRRCHAWDTIDVSAYLDEGSQMNATYSWHSSMVDRGQASMVSDSATLRIVYYDRGMDTLTCIVTNNYGSDTAQAVSDVVDCTTIHRYPWKDDFEHGLDCWSQYGGWQEEITYGSYEGEYALHSGYDNGYQTYSWIISQPFAIPALADTSMMELIWQMRTRSSYQYDYNQFSLRIAIVADDAVPSANSFTTVYSQELHYGPWTEYRYDLSAYAGQTIRFMFHNLCNSDAYEPFYLIDNVEVRSTRLPIITLTAPNRSDELDSVAFTLTLVEGDTNGLTYTWHSSLLDSTWVSTSLSTYAGGRWTGVTYLTYPLPGMDTVTVVASNAWGSDTAVVTVRLFDCSQQSIPIEVDFEDAGDISCWSGFVGNYSYDWNSGHQVYTQVADTTPWTIGGNATNHYATTSAYGGWLVTPAIDVPDDATDLYLSWDQSWSGISVNLSVSVATGENYLSAPGFTSELQSGSSDVGLRRFPMDAFAGLRIHVGFALTSGYGTARIDNFSLAFHDVAPVATMTAPDTVLENQPVPVAITLNDCSRRNLTVTLHSMLLDSTIVVADTNLVTLYYPLAGTDVLTLVASNAWGADTQQVTLMVLGCSNLGAPYQENFSQYTGTLYNSASGELPTCWTILWNGSVANGPKVLASGSYPFNNYSSNALLLMAGSSNSTWDSVAYAVLPHFTNPLQVLSVAFRHVHENANNGTLTVGYIDAGTFVPVTDIPAVAGNGGVDTVNFGSAPATATQIALRWKKTATWYSVLIDDVSVFVENASLMPTQAQILGPSTLRAPDTATFTAHLRYGDTAGLTCTWHSTLLDTTVTLNTPLLTLYYPLPGIDTLTLIASSVTGADTVSKIVTVTGLPEVVISGPTSVYTEDSAAFTAIVNGGDTNSLVYTWHSSLLDTTLTLTTPSVTLYYPLAGVDTLTLTVTNLLGQTTLHSIVTVVGCDHISTFPWSEGFEGGIPACWRTYCTEGIGFSWYAENYSSWAHGGTHCAVSNMGSVAIDWLYMPPIDVPSSGSLDLNFWVNFASSSVNGTLRVLASTTGRSSLEAFADTLLYETNHTYYPNLGYSNTYVPRSISLAPYAGQTVWIAFVNGPSVLYLDDISIEQSGLPVVGLTGPTSIRSSDTAHFTATLLQGDTTGLTYLWHSIKAARGMAGAVRNGVHFDLDYYEAGEDVITVIVSNAVGSDTAQITCNVTDCEPISEFPYTKALTSYNALRCWDFYNVVDPYGDHQWRLPYGATCVSTSNGWPDTTVDVWLVTQEFDIPAGDSLSYTFQWHLYCHHSSYQVLASTQGHGDVSLFTDLLFSESRDTSSWTTRSLSLDAYRGQRVYLAFRNTGWYNSSTMPPTYSDVGAIFIDTIRVLVAPDSTFTPEEPDTVWRTVMVASNPEGWGTVTLSSDAPVEGEADGEYLLPDSSLVTLTAIAFQPDIAGVEILFDHWNDGDTTSPRQVLVTGDTAFTAYFRWVEDSVGIPEVLGVHGLEVSLYPNPAHGEVMVSLRNNDAPATVSFVDTYGRVVIPPMRIASDLRVPIADLPAGTYLMILVTADGQKYALRLLKGGK